MSRHVPVRIDQRDEERFKYYPNGTYLTGVALE